MFYGRDAEQAIRFSAESSRTTHGARTCVDACRYYGGLIWAALQGASKEVLLSSSYCPIKGLWSKEPLCSEIAEIAEGSFKTKNPPQIRGTGFVVRSLEAALWAFFHSDTYRSGCLLAANLGDDADTTAAIYGQLAGAHYGKSGIPAPWLERHSQASKIETMAHEIFCATNLPA